MRFLTLIYLLLAASFLNVHSQSSVYWHGKERKLRYTPEGEDFVIVNGDRKFNRALYGTNTAFRVETGDLPELGFFMPNMGGNMQFGLIKGDKSLWLNDAEYIKSIYRPGSRIYEIKDPFFGQGQITLTVLAMSDAEGMVMKIETSGLPAGIDFITLYGGASNKRFSRNGDLGVDDPEAFFLKPENCEGNKYELGNNSFSLVYGEGTKGGPCKIDGVFPDKSELKIASPYKVMTPSLLWSSVPFTNEPALVSKTSISNSGSYYIALQNGNANKLYYANLKNCFDNAEAKRQEIAGTIKINTPDPMINTLGGVISTAGDGIWDDLTNSWQHGAIGWRMPLNGWRGAYTGDVLGWHDRARRHFDGYANSQITNIEPSIPHPAQDKGLNMARAEKKWGTQMYSNGYIGRNPNNTNQMHHYDMNLVYIDELLWHFNWTGDMDYVRKMWPVLKSHLAWEKRNFDPNDDGLYDAYAGIWASDALQYNSGGVTHSSSYNYRANKMAAQIAEKLGEDPTPYKNEAAKILKAVNSQLWLADKGWWAEYKDLMGNQMIHPNAGIWTVYHAIDSDIHTPFQAYQATRYIDTEIPHIPVLAKGLDNDEYEMVATTNWLPYSWSINNVAFAEVGHTSLAYWQAGRPEEGFKLFKSAVLDGMYLGDSPGNIGQVSFYDAARGECYRDFADPVGVYSRAVVQGLFGIMPDLMNKRIVIRPGFPSDWEYASISTPDIAFDFKQNGKSDKYIVENKYNESLEIELLLRANYSDIKSIIVNGKSTRWTLVENVGFPLIKIITEKGSKFDITIDWAGNTLDNVVFANNGINGAEWILSSKAKIEKVYDPQNILKRSKKTSSSVSGILNGVVGNRTLFVETKEGQMTWWQPVDVKIDEPFSVDYNSESDKLEFGLFNNSTQDENVTVVVNGSSTKFELTTLLKGGQLSDVISVPDEYTSLGTNLLEVKKNGNVVYETKLINWNLKNTESNYDLINLDSYLNASVSNIFKNEYLTPRSPFTTLQVPTQGIGEWCHPLLMADIDDSGIRKAAVNNVLTTPMRVPFRTTGQEKANNIAFTTLWDNYPTDITVPLSGKASHVYLMMAGSTNHMQSHVVNATVTVTYTDGTQSILELIPPETWAPIEQDFFLDGKAFRSKYPRPYRVALKTGVISRDMEKDMGVKASEVYGRSIDGGAGIILDLPLDKNKELKSLELKTIANEVVIGLMAATLVR